MWAPSCSFRSAWPSPALLVPSRSSASRTRKAARQGARRGVRAGADEDTFVVCFCSSDEVLLFLHIFSGTSGNDAGSWPTSARGAEGHGAMFVLTPS